MIDDIDIFRLRRKMINASVYGKFGQCAPKEKKTMKQPYDKIFDTICNRVQWEKDNRELGKPNQYKEWQSFLQRYIADEPFLDKGER